jgi:hypothetical protein
MAGLIVSFSTVSTPVSAHETFLLPAKNAWSVGNQIEIRMASSLSFPVLTWGITQDRISKTVIRLGGVDVTTFSLNNNDAFLKVSFMAQHSGSGVVAMSTKPRSGVIGPENTEGYLDEIGAAPSVREAFRALPGEAALHRSYAKHTKTFICVEDCSASRSANTTPVGQELEFIADAGATNVFQLLRAGNPLSHHEVKVRTSDKKLHKFATDGNGELTIGGEISGVIMLTAVAITLPEQADGLYHSDYATLVLDIARAQQ